MIDSQRQSSLVRKKGLVRQGAGLLAFALAGTVTASAMADIRMPGDHPHYSFELEPEAIFAVEQPIDESFGVGVRGSIPVLFNGFIPKLNNSVAVTFGFDKVPLSQRHTYYVPVALQWNFFIARIFSVAGEPGVLLTFDDKVRVHPEVWGLARLHFNDNVALVARMSVPETPAFSIGVSFFF